MEIEISSGKWNKSRTHHKDDAGNERFSGKLTNSLVLSKLVTCFVNFHVSLVLVNFGVLENLFIKICGNFGLNYVVLYLFEYSGIINN